MELTVLFFLLCILPAFPAISLHKGRCVDKYDHCREWSEAGYCNIRGYTTYMDLMCSYSCSKCPDHIEVARASGDEKGDNLGLGSASDSQTQEDVSSTVDASKEEVSSNSEESTTFNKPRPNDSVSPNAPDNDQNSDVNQASFEDANPPGVRNIAIPKDLPDDVNPRSKITKPISQLSHMVQTLKKTIAQTNEANQKAIADLYSTNYESSSDQGDHHTSVETPANQEAAGSAGSASAEEMKDIAGEVRTGSKIFEEDTAEPESTSGCSSGYGCYSEPGEQVRQSKNDEVQELESRSKIDVPEPQQQAKIDDNSVDAKKTAIDNHGEDVNGVSKTRDINAPTKNENKAFPKIDIDSPKKEEGEIAKTDIDSAKLHEDKMAKIDIDSSKKDVDETANSDIDSPNKHEEKVEKIDVDASTNQHDDKVDHITVSQKDTDKSKSIDQNVDRKTETADKSQKNDITSASETHSKDRQQDDISDNKDKVETDATEGNSGSGENALNMLELQNDQIYHKEKTKPSEDSGSGKGSQAATPSKEDPGIDKIIKEDEEEEDIDRVKTDNESTDKSNEGPKVIMHGEETAEKNDDDNKSISKVVNEEVRESGSGSQDTEEDNIEDALYENGMRDKSNKTEEPKTPKNTASSESVEIVPIDNNEGAKSKNGSSTTDLTSPKNKLRLTSIENLIANGKLKRKPYAEAKAGTREELPKIENKEADSTFLASKIGKSHHVSVILDQHYYKPYNNEDSMAYEMLALDLKKEVERAVGGQALVSQIKFSEIKKPGKLPSYSRVLATFRFYGDEKSLQKAVEKGLVGDIMVDKAFYQSS